MKQQPPPPPHTHKSCSLFTASLPNRSRNVWPVDLLVFSEFSGGFACVGGGGVHKYYNTGLHTSPGTTDGRRAGSVPDEVGDPARCIPRLLYWCWKCSRLRMIEDFISASTSVTLLGLEVGDSGAPLGEIGGELRDL